MLPSTDRSRPYVLRVTSDDGNPAAGILVSENYAVTCWHVANGSGKFSEKVPNSREAAWGLCAGGRPAEVVAWGDLPGIGYEVDVALLKLEGAPASLESADLALAYDSRLFDQLLDSVSYLEVEGFPRHSPTSHVESCRPHKGSGSSSTSRGGQVTEFGLFARVHEGVSGGPVVAGRGGEEVCVGMACLGSSRSLQMAAVSSGELLALLEHHFDGELPHAVRTRPLDDWLIDHGVIETRGSYLRALRARVEEDHDLLRMLGVDDLADEFFDRVYVRLEVGVSPSFAQRLADLGDEEDASIPPSGVRLDQLLSIPPARFGIAGPRFVLRGEPGSGKTTILRQLAWSLAGDDDAAWTPVRIGLPDFARWRAGQNRKGDAWDKLLDYLEEQQDIADARREALVAEREHGRLLLLLDGLDEVRGELRTTTRSWLANLSEQMGSSAIVVATRTIPYRKPAGGYVEADVEPMGIAQQKKFLSAWIGDEGAAEDHIKRWADLPHSRLSLLAGNPLWLTYFGLLLRRGETPDESRSALYEQVLELLLSGEFQDPPKKNPNPAVMRAGLVFLAVQMSKKGETAVRKSDLDALFQEQGVETDVAVRAVLNEWSRRPDDFLQDVQAITGIIGRYGEKEGRNWRFWHGQLREVLVMIWLRSLTRDEQLAEAAALAEDHLGFFAEPFALLVGTDELADKDEMIERLVEHNPVLGRRVLASATGVSPSTVEKVLGLDSSDPERRGEILLDLPNILGRGEGARAATIQLVERLWMASRSSEEEMWADCYHLDELLVALEEEPGELVSTRRALYFRRFGQPDRPTLKELFPPIHGLTPFPRIDPGSFAMGDGDAPSRQQVKIPTPFRLGATPVTESQFSLMSGREIETSSRKPKGEINFFGAMLYSRFLGWAMGSDQPGDLPTEAQWEYAARAGNEGDYWFSPGALDDHGWYEGNSGGRVHDVATRPPDGEEPQQPNPNGLFDVHGNVWEWCQDLLGGAGPWRVMRGGSFWDSAANCRSGYRIRNHPASRLWDLGFRVVLPADRSLAIDD
ncbi:SUMF1/EgtB/PvdO family nonheme iron enzyme [Engelhardtia mirabilis]|uniref:Serine/threonine-protein kinase pkn1 n=1 Tax=Engelhardtia mirabilis TaxID=2528011 RepID=A0A518BKZ8_9BACT|nr:Serine/threonine-protein kinase pkn1 [Planctomycetes bacterium Pla133]QDV01977.1 Serine/threonine-protein kinase pkn1 [Planctomycetes bacterium Pla86]